jgi:hypothetical protein
MSHDHKMTRMERLYFGFTCSAQPKMEFLSGGDLKRCPICREPNPMKQEPK